MNDFLEEQAALYVSGAMTLQERQEFELILEFDDDLRKFAAELAEAGVSIALTGLRRSEYGPSAELKARILDRVLAHPQKIAQDCLVIAGPDGLVHWVNPAFSAMCGYSLEELRGKRLGPILQGEKTDRATAERLRSAVHGCRPCREVILNYHKDGSPYLVEIAITPILDGAGQPLWLAAREHKIAVGFEA
jgi:PAS domain S-box-containing protein